MLLLVQVRRLLVLMAAIVFTANTTGATATIDPNIYPNIPTIDISKETAQQVIIDREYGQYLGHPSTVLLDDNKTMVVVYPRGHGKGQIHLKRSSDAGLTWSGRLPVPDNWSTSKETPTIYRMVDPQGVERIILFSGVLPVRTSVSENGGLTWTQLEPIGDFGGVVAMSSVVRLKDGSYMALAHYTASKLLNLTGIPTENREKWARLARWALDDRLVLYKTISTDGGLTWTWPEIIAGADGLDLTEPGAVRSPDGSQIAVLIRENTRKENSMIIFSNDEGASWTDPVKLPASLTGDRHVARYAPDGRLVIVFRDLPSNVGSSPTKGDFIAWVGTYDDLINRGEGQYRVRLLDNQSVPYDTGYAGLELLPDGTFVATTYCVLEPGERPLVVSVRFNLEQLDKMSPTFTIKDLK